MLLTVVLGVFGIPVAKSLSASGFQDPTSESAAAAQVLTDKFRQGAVQLLVVVSTPDGVDSAPARAVGKRDRRPTAQFATCRAGDLAVDRAAACRSGPG